MNLEEQRTEFLSRKLAPARLNAAEAGWILGFKPHQVPILIIAGLLKPLGHPARNSPKYFAVEIIEQRSRDEKWLSRASDAIHEYWRRKNARKSSSLRARCHSN